MEVWVPDIQNPAEYQKQKADTEAEERWKEKREIQKVEKNKDNK